MDFMWQVYDYEPGRQYFTAAPSGQEVDYFQAALACLWGAPEDIIEGLALLNTNLGTVTGVRIDHGTGVNTATPAIARANTPSRPTMPTNATILQYNSRSDLIRWAHSVAGMHRRQPRARPHRKGLRPGRPQHRMLAIKIGTVFVDSIRGGLVLIPFDFVPLVDDRRSLSYAAVETLALL